MNASRRALAILFLLTLPLVTPRIRGADEIEYFVPVRSAVFDGDLDYTNEYTWFVARDPQGLAPFRETFLERREPLTGRPINFAPVGSALLWSPAYLVTHAGVSLLAALGLPLTADGLSLPYAATACLASAAYGFLGLLLIHDALVRFGGAPPEAAALTVAVLWTGTPLLYYMTLAAAFSHATSVFTVALVVWLALRDRERAGLLPWALQGAAIGMCALVREQDALFGIVPAGLLLLRTVRERSWTTGVLRAVLMGVSSAVVFVPQLLAYRALNGTFGPSRLVARKMTWSSPHALEVLFDPGHGLFLWTPILLVAALALLVRAARRREAAVVLLALAFVLQIWINGCVESWHLAGAFGARRFVASLPLLAWGLVAVFTWLLARRRSLAVAAAVACAWWNVSLMVQFGLRLMDRQRLDWPGVLVRQVTDVPPRMGRAAWLFFTDREQLVRESR